METLNSMRAWAKQTGAVIAGSVSVEDGGKFYNRLYWVRPDGTFNHYNKRHLFQLAGEHHQYAPGNQIIIEDIGGWKICPMVCYDLRFPVWSRNSLVDGKPKYDVLIYLANWPEVRREPWKKLLLARAIENQCYVVGVNRIGVDASGFFHAGDSSVINPRGEYIVELNPGMEDTRTVSIEWVSLEIFRSKFPVLGDADEFNIVTG
jgi:predicted amidohydrolase